MTLFCCSASPSVSPHLFLLVYHAHLSSGMNLRMGEDNKMLSCESRRTAGALFVILPTVLYEGYFLLTQLIDPDSGYMQNPLRQNLFRACSIDPHRRPR
jgi:hypothetical protein